MSAWAMEHPWLTFTLIALAIVALNSSIDDVARRIGGSK